MITVTANTLIIIVVSLVAIVGWVLGYKEYVSKAKTISGLKADHEKETTELKASLDVLLNTKEEELEEVEKLVKDKMEEIQKSYQSVMDEQNESLALYESYIKNFDAAITLASVKLKDLDDKGVFESDDEIGFFFNYVKNLQLMLDRFKIDKQILDTKEA